MPSRANQHRLVGRLQRCHLADCQRTLLFVLDLLHASPVAPLHWRYRWVVSRYSCEDGSTMGPFQSPRLLGHRGQHSSLRLLYHCYLLLFLATRNANYGGDDQL